MVDVARLAFLADTSQTKKAKGDLNAMATASKGAAFQMDKFGKQANQSSRAAGKAGLGFRNLGLQLNQVAQQGAITGNFIQAFAFQLPDILLGFGTMGIAIGVVAGALTPLAMSLMDATNEAYDFTEALDEIKDISDGLESVLDVMERSVRDLADTYGDAADEVRAFSLVQAELRVAMAAERLQESVNALREVSGAYETAANSGRNYRLSLQRIERDFGLTRGAAVEFEEALTRLNQAETLDQQTNELQNILSLLEQNGVAASEIPPEFAKAIDEMITLHRETSEAERLSEKAADAASLIKGEISDAADAAQQLTSNILGTVTALESLRNQRESLTYSGRGGDPRQIANQAQGTNLGDTFDIQAEIERFERAQERERNRGRRRGGGKSEAQKAIEDAQREAQRIFEDTRTAAENYSMEIEGLNALLEAGLISQETYNRAVEQAEERLREADEAGQFFRQTIGDAFIDMATGAATFEQAMVQVAASIAEAAFQAALFGDGPMSGLFGGSGGGLFGALGIPFFARGTKNAPGGLAMVGEQGRELVHIPEGSRVYSNQDTESMLAGEGVRDLESMVTNPSPMAAGPPNVTVKNENIILFDEQEARERLINSPDGQANLAKVMPEIERA